jgi:hypothetical protein
VDLQSLGGTVNKYCSGTTKTFPVQYFYDVFVQNQNGTYAEVPVSFSGSYYKRFTPKVFQQV